MRRKINVTALAIVMALMCAIGFVACGNDGGGAKSEKISTAEEWKAAFDYSEKSNGTVLNSRTMITSEGSMTDVSTMYFDGDKMMYKRESGENISVSYGYKIGGDAYRNYEYDEGGDEWYYSVDNYSEIKESLGVVMRGYDRFIDEFTDTDKYLSDRYDEFSYDEKRGLYVLTFEKLESIYDEGDELQTEEYYDVEFTVFISGGKATVCTLGLYQKDEHDQKVFNDFTFRFYDMEKTSVTLPNATERH